MKNKIKDALYKGFIKDARNTLTSAYKQRVNFSEDAKIFGGSYCTKSEMPDGYTETLPYELKEEVITFIDNYIKNHSKDKEK